MQGLWDSYYKSAGSCPNTQVARVAALHRGPRRQALDLGAGNLRDARFLLAAGFGVVVAVDKEPMPHVPRINRVQMPLEQYLPMPNSYDFAVCYNTLFFIKKEDALKVVTRAYNSLTEGGQLVFNLLGAGDGWFKNPPPPPLSVYSYTGDEILNMTSGFDKAQIEHTTGRFPCAEGGEKYWDVWKVTVSKAVRS